MPHPAQDVDRTAKRWHPMCTDSRQEMVKNVPWFLAIAPDMEGRQKVPCAQSRGRESIAESGLSWHPGQGISWQGARWRWSGRFAGQSAPAPESPIPARTSPEVPLKEAASVSGTAQSGDINHTSCLYKRALTVNNG